MLRLRKDLSIIPPSQPNGEIKILDPFSGVSLSINSMQVQILRLIAKIPPIEAAGKLNIPEKEVQDFINLLSTKNLLENLSGNTISPDKSKNNESSLNQSLSNNQLRSTRNNLAFSKTAESLAKADSLDNPESMLVSSSPSPPFSALSAIELKPDLVFAEQGDSCLVEDPSTNRFFTLGETEIALLEQLSRQDLASVEAESGYSQEELAEFIQSMSRKGLLIRPLSQINQEQEKDSRPQPSILNLFIKRIPLGNPDEFLTNMNSAWGWLWRGPLMGIHWGIILFALYLWVDQGSLFQAYGLPKIFSEFWLNALLLVGLICGIIALHEFAHGLTLKAFGGTVPEMGVFLLYGFPSAYTNVSSAYRLKEVSEKIWVVMAGVLFQAWLGSLAYTIWCFAEPHSWIADWSYLLAFASCINLAINLNPLIKLDGYYLLTLWINKPNLRDKAWNFLTSGFQGAKSFGEIILFFFYGILSMAYTSVLIYFVLSRIWSLGMDNAPFMTVLILLIVFLATKTPLPRKDSEIATNEESRSSHPQFNGDHIQKPHSANLIKANANQIPIAMSMQGSVQPQEKQKKKQKPFKLNLFPLLFLGAIITLLFLEIPYQIGGEVEVTPVEKSRALVFSPIQGIIEKVYVSSGNYVKEGDKLFDVIDYQLMEQLSQTTGNNSFMNQPSSNAAPKLESLRSQVEQLKIQSQKLVINLEKAKLKYQNDKRKADTYTKLAAEGAFPQNLAQDAIYNAQASEQEIKGLESEIELNREIQKSARSEYNSQSGQIQFYKQKANLQSVTSPIDGYILTEDTDLQKGGMALTQQPILSIANLKEVQVKIKVPQEEFPSVKIGLPVKLSIKAYPNQSFTGVVSDLALVNENPQKADPTVVKDISRKRWNVIMIIHNDDLLLKPGMTGYAFIDSSERKRIWQFVLKEIQRVFSLERFSVFRDSFEKAKLF
jgi:putative peptide zinc metalloprotease protein